MKLHDVGGVGLLLQVEVTPLEGLPGGDKDKVIIEIFLFMSILILDMCNLF